MFRSGPQTVQCYHCRHRFDVAARAQSTACPKCSKSLFVGDIIVKQLKPVREVRTCGKVIVQKTGRIIAELIEAHRGIECLGHVDVKKALAGPVSLGPKATWKGDCHALSLTVKQGAKITAGRFTIPDDPLQIGDLFSP